MKYSQQVLMWSPAIPNLLEAYSAVLRGKKHGHLALYVFRSHTLLKECTVLC
jgi:hypothetical protein